MINFQSPGFGSVKSVYSPAGTLAPAITRSLSVTNVVAAFAPVRHQTFHGTTSPKITRPRALGRLYAIQTCAPPTVARTVSEGEYGPMGGRFANIATSDFTSTFGCAVTVTCSVDPGAA